MKEIFTDYYKNGHWNIGAAESPSGPGSSLKRTRRTRKWIGAMIGKYGMTSMLDIPCGDYNWMQLMRREIPYIGADIVDELVEENNKKYKNEKTRFLVLDVTKDSLPEADVILCRDLLQHLSTEDALKAVENIKRSKARYLMITSHAVPKNKHTQTGGFRRLNLLLEPFCFPEPLELLWERANARSMKQLLLFKLGD